MTKKIYYKVTRVFPKPIREKLLSILSYYSKSFDHEQFIGFITVSSILLGFLLGFFFGWLFNFPFWIFVIGFIALINAVVYIWIFLLVDKKTQLVEEALPDALQLIASNLRAGMTPDKALLLSAREEFGPLKEEIDAVGKKVALGESISVALDEMSSHIRSVRLRRTVELIVAGLNSGGGLAVLLEATANHLKEQLLVDKKIKASVSMYFIFIFAASAIITPVLLGLSSILVDVLSITFSQVSIPSTAASTLPIQASGPSDAIRSFLPIFLILFLVVNSFMASLLLGLLARGKQREGIRYFLFMILLAIPIFFVARLLIKSLLGGVFEF